MEVTMKQAKVTALCNQKGGVGKTTTCANLGIGLAMEGKKVLLIDSDPQASLSYSLGVNDPDLLKQTLSEIILHTIDENEIPEKFGIYQHEEGVDFIPSNIGLSAIDVTLINTMSREYVLKRYIDTVRDKYDVILIDCMPSLGMMTMNALVAADSVIIPSQPHFLSAMGLDQLMGTISKIKRQLNPNLTVDGILLTMVNSRANFTKEMIDIMQKQYRGSIRIFDTQIPVSIRAAETSSQGVSIFKYNNSGKVAQSYRELTKEVLGIEKRFIKNKAENVR